MGAVEKNQTIHFAHPGITSLENATGSSAVSCGYRLSMQHRINQVEIGQVKKFRQEPTLVVRAVWSGDEPSSTSIEVMVSNDNGSTWEGAENNVEVFLTQGAGNKPVLLDNDVKHR